MSFETEVDLGEMFKARKKLQFINIQINGQFTANQLLLLGERILQLARDTIAFKTGAARESIQLIIDPDGKSMVIGSDGGVGADGRKIYLRYLELGTSKMRAQPWLFPSAVIALNEFKERYPLKLKEKARIGV